MARRAQDPMLTIPLESMVIGYSKREPQLAAAEEFANKLSAAFYEAVFKDENTYEAVFKDENTKQQFINEVQSNANKMNLESLLIQDNLSKDRNQKKVIDNHAFFITIIKIIIMNTILERNKALWNKAIKRFTGGMKRHESDLDEYIHKEMSELNQWMELKNKIYKEIEKAIAEMYKITDEICKKYNVTDHGKKVLYSNPIFNPKYHEAVSNILCRKYNKRTKAELREDLNTVVKMHKEHEEKRETLTTQGDKDAFDIQDKESETKIHNIISVAGNKTITRGHFITTLRNLIESDTDPKQQASITFDFDTQSKQRTLIASPSISNKADVDESHQERPKMP